MGLLFVLILVIMLTQGVKRELYKDSNVSAGIITHRIDWLFPHAAVNQYITVNNKTYKWIRGVLPYYANILNGQKILFVVDEPHRDVMFHIVGLSPPSDVVIDGGHTGFGWSLGSANTNGIPADFIKSVTSNQLVLVTRSFNWQETYTIDLDSGVFQ